MSKRFGKYRVPGCQCTLLFTCKPCLSEAPPYFYTSDNGTVITVPRPTYKPIAETGE